MGTCLRMKSLRVPKYITRLVVVFDGAQSNDFSSVYSFASPLYDAGDFIVFILLNLVITLKRTACIPPIIPTNVCTIVSGGV